ncbi:MAG: hypothetical protein SGPRY_001288, partial [Prymnesium sp.]
VAASNKPVTPPRTQGPERVAAGARVMDKSSLVEDSSIENATPRSRVAPGGNSTFSFGDLPESGVDRIAMLKARRAGTSEAIKEVTNKIV